MVLAQLHAQVINNFIILKKVKKKYLKKKKKFNILLKI